MDFDFYYIDILEEVIMKKIIVIFSLIAGMIAVLPAQDNLSKKEQKKLEREKRLMAEFESTKHILENKLFILEANRLYDRYGNSVSVSSMTNFIGVDSSSAIIQTGNPHRIGYNGLGGITAEGRITNFELDINEKKKTFRITMNVNSPLGMYEVHMDIGASGYANATLFGIRGRSISYYGEIVPIAESIVYEGVESYF